MKERREGSRLEYAENISYMTSSSLGRGKKGVQSTGEGRIVDFSKGGICLFTKNKISANQVLKINIPVRGVPVQTPTLAMVRWSEPYEDGYKVGMMFII